jgi:DNA polymerase-1
MQGRKSRMILQVHDELLFDLHQDERDELPTLVLEAMESAIILPNEVPIKIDLGFGDNWLQAH